MTVDIRRMTWRDIAPVVDLEQGLFPVDAWSAEQFWGELAQPSRHYCVAETDGAIIGYGGIMAIGATADLQTIAIAGQAQGTGTGRRLLETLIAIAVDQGCTEMLLEVRSDNAAAQRLYLARGFEVIAHRRDYYGPGIDAQIMRLRPLDGAA
jgi:ribosomal-protein-alanine N-acetyltransferase